MNGSGQVATNTSLTAQAMRLSKNCGARTSNEGVDALTLSSMGWVSVDVGVVKLRKC